MKVLYLFLFVCGLGLAQSDSVVLNELFDSLLTSANEVITKAGKQTVPIPFIQIPFHRKKWWYSITGTLTCQNGVVGELNTLKRTGDAVMTTQGNTITLKTTLGLGVLDFSFPICRAKARFISVHGKTSGKITSDSLTLQLSLTYNGNDCTAKLDTISLDNIGQLTLDLGGGDFHEFEELLIEFMIKKFNGDIKDKINSKLMTTLGSAIAVDSKKLCDKIHL